MLDKVSEFADGAPEHIGTTAFATINLQSDRLIKYTARECMRRNSRMVGHCACTRRGGGAVWRGGALWWSVGR